MIPTNDDRIRVTATALVYAMQVLAHMPEHRSQPLILSEMDHLLSELNIDERVLQRARQIAASHVAQMIKKPTPEKPR